MPATVIPTAGKFADNSVQSPCSESGHVFKENERWPDFFGQPHDLKKKPGSLAFQALPSSCKTDILARSREAAVDNVNGCASFLTSFPQRYGLIFCMPSMVAAIAEPAYRKGFIVVVVMGLNSASAILESDRPMALFTDLRVNQFPGSHSSVDDTVCADVGSFSATIKMTFLSISLLRSQRGSAFKQLPNSLPGNPVNMSEISKR
jgi:hypothetical protein